MHYVLIIIVALAMAFLITGTCQAQISLGSTKPDEEAPAEEEKIQEENAKEEVAQQAKPVTPPTQFRVSSDERFGFNKPQRIFVLAVVFAVLLVVSVACFGVTPELKFDWPLSAMQKLTIGLIIVIPTLVVAYYLFF
jgi:hypothetical protein